jgi:thiamine kinase-like enzyme
MDNHLYNWIQPDKHYSLLHGDLGYQNVIFDKFDGMPRILDWSTYTIGPHFIDIARYLTSLLVPYSTIKTLYLDDNPNGQRLSTIERIFFLYAVILFYFQKIGRLGIETNISSDLLPALEDLEVLVMQFKNTMGENEMTEKQHSLSEELREKEVKIKQLEQRLSIVEDERKYLHKRLQNIINSKSWKITTPLRIFTEGIKKKELN